MLPRTSLPHLLPLVLTCACASAPAFEPSRPIGESGTLGEALLLCHEYELPDPAERPVALKPFLRCLDQAADAHPADASRDPFRVFRAEFHLQYGLLREAQWTPMLGLELGVAVHALLQAVVNPLNRDYASATQELVLRHFPQTAAAVGAARWKAGRRPRLPDPQLEALQAEARTLQAGNRTQPGGDFCGRVVALHREVDYLAGLWNDARDIALLDASAAKAVRARYRERLERASGELKRLREAAVAAPACGSN